MSHYIRLDSQNRVIAGFSDAFETPQPGDICILDDPQQRQRQFMLNGQYNPPILDANLLPLYKYVDGAVLPTTADDNTDLAYAMKAAAASAPLTIEQRINLIQAAIDSLAMGGTTNG